MTFDAICNSFETFLQERTDEQKDSVLHVTSLQLAFIWRAHDSYNNRKNVGNIYARHGINNIKDV